MDCILPSLVLHTSRCWRFLGEQFAADGDVLFGGCEVKWCLRESVSKDGWKGNEERYLAVEVFSVYVCFFEEEEVD